jgi:putative heme-binding domain-containing protein
MNMTWAHRSIGALFLCAAVSIVSAAETDLGAVGVKYRRACAVCHGGNGHGGRGPDLVSGRWAHGGTDEDLFRVIAKGVPGTDMPAFLGGRYNEDDIRGLVAYVRSLADKSEPVKVTGNAQRGQEIYWGKGNCQSCHMVTGRGGRLGPDLSRIGAQRSPASLKESLLKPEAVIVTGYEAARVRRGGRTIQGIIKNQDNFTIQIFDGENHHSFDRAGAQVENMKESIMPAYTSFSAAEIDDLVAYMDSLRGK